MKELICLIGPSGAGKSTAGRMLEEKFGYTYITASKYLRELKKNIEDTINYSYDLNELIASVSAIMPKGFNEYVEHIFLNCHSNKIVWDSCININHLDIILRHFDKVYFLCFNAPYNQRIKRILERGSFGDAPFDTVKQKVFCIDQYERVLGLGDLMLFADWTIIADRLDDLDRELVRFVSQCSPTTIPEKIRYCNETYIPPKKFFVTEPLLQYLKRHDVQL